MRPFPQLDLHLPMPLDEFTLVLVAVVDSAALSVTGGAASSALIVDVDVDRLKPEVNGAR